MGPFCDIFSLVFSMVLPGFSGFGVVWFLFDVGSLLRRDGEKTARNYEIRTQRVAQRILHQKSAPEDASEASCGIL